MAIRHQIVTRVNTFSVLFQNRSAELDLNVPYRRFVVPRWQRILMQGQLNKVGLGGSSMPEVPASGSRHSTLDGSSAADRFADLLRELQGVHDQELAVLRRQISALSAQSGQHQTEFEAGTPHIVSGDAKCAGLHLARLNVAESADVVPPMTDVEPQMRLDITLDDRKASDSRADSSHVVPRYQQDDVDFGIRPDHAESADVVAKSALERAAHNSQACLGHQDSAVKEEAAGFSLIFIPQDGEMGSGSPADFPDCLLKAVVSPAVSFCDHPELVAVVPGTLPVEGEALDDLKHEIVSSGSATDHSESGDDEIIQTMPVRVPRHLARSATRAMTFRPRAVWVVVINSNTKSMHRQTSFARRCPSHEAVKRAETAEVLTLKGHSPLQRFMLHPCSTKRLVWDLLSMSVLGYDLVTIPLVEAFNPPITSFMVGMTWFVLCFWTLDMGASFLTGYQEGKRAVLEPKLVAWNYLKSWFPLDVLIVSCDWFYVLIVGQGTSAARLGRSLRIARAVRTLRLMRMLKLKRILQEIQDNINTESISIIFGIAKIVLFLLAANHIVACCWYGLGVSAEEGSPSWVRKNAMASRSLAYQYTTSLHWSLTQFTPASMEVQPTNSSERLFAVCVLMLAMLSFSSFLSILTASAVALKNIATNESRQFWMLRRYLRDWGVCRRTGLRIQRYLEFAYKRQQQRVQEKDVQLLDLLSGPLREELKYETFAGHLSGHPLFSSCVARQRVFSRALAAVSLARDDLAFDCGEQASKMIFISCGLLEYMIGDVEGQSLMSEAESTPTPTDAVLEGQWVSEAVLWTTWLHLGDLRALQMCQLITIDAQRFGEAIQTIKPLWNTVRLYADGFISELNSAEKDDLSDLAHHLFSAQELVDNCDFSDLISTSRNNFDDMEEESFFTAFQRKARRGGRRVLPFC